MLEKMMREKVVCQISVFILNVRISSCQSGWGWRMAVLDTVLYWPQSINTNHKANINHACPFSSGVNKRWNRVAFSSVLWKALYPTQWTRNVWSFDYIPPKDTDIPQVDVINSFCHSHQSTYRVWTIKYIEDPKWVPLAQMHTLGPFKNQTGSLA
jgi:hypothetical protein